MIEHHQISSEKALGQKFFVSPGITESQIAQLISLTSAQSDPAIMRNTSDWKDGQGRFASRLNFDKWINKGRSVYVLSQNKQDLAGIVWYGAEQLPLNGNTFIKDFDPSKYGITYAIRLYTPARGMGLAPIFTTTTLKLFQSSLAYQNITNKGIWLETNSDNISAIKAYEKIGCKQVSTSTQNGRIIMVFPPLVWLLKIMF